MGIKIDVEKPADSHLPVAEEDWEDYQKWLDGEFEDLAIERANQELAEVVWESMVGV